MANKCEFTLLWLNWWKARVFLAFKGLFCLTGAGHSLRLSLPFFWVDFNRNLKFNGNKVTY
jgi:hypothetical protein